jgi:hypothetical protein
MRSEIQLRTVIKVPFSALRASALAYHHAGLNGRMGIDTRQRKIVLPPGCKLSPGEHVEKLVEDGALGGGHVLMQTHRNAFQNPRSPIFSRKYGLCQAAGEEVEKSRRAYYGIAHLGDGRLRGLALHFDRPIPEEIQFWSAGVPVLWDGRVLTPEEMAPEAGDFCHLWDLRVYEGEGHRAEDVTRFDRLKAVFDRHLHAPAAEAGRAILREARGLERESAYLHNAVGVGADALVIVLANGPLEFIGETARQAGATHAVVMDNGGSCQIALKRMGAPPRPLAESHYFREPTIALAAYEFSSSDPDRVPLHGSFNLLQPHGPGIPSSPQ